MTLADPAGLLSCGLGESAFGEKLISQGSMLLIAPDCICNSPLLM